MPEKHIDIESQDITYNSLVKIVMGIVFIIGWTIGVYAWVSSINTKVDLIKQEQTMMHAMTDKRLAAIEEQMNRSDKVQQDLLRAIDKANILLEEMQKREKLKP